MVIKIELGNYNSELGRIDYTEYFANGKAFYEVCEKTDWSKALSVSFGSDIKNNNLKLKASGTLAEIETIQSYKHIKISIDNVLYFMGYGSTVSKNFENDLTVDADISFDSYAKTFKGFEHTGNLVEYTSGYKICSPADQAHSMLHLLAGYIIDNAQEECHTTFNLICTYTDTADCGYVNIDSGDSYLDKFSDFLKQNGLGFCVDKTNIVIYDMVANHSGTATTAQNVEAKLTINEKPYNNTKLAQIKYGTIQTLTNAKVARIAMSIRGAVGQDTLEGDLTLDLDTSNQNVKVLQIKNPVRKFYTDEGIFGGKITVQEWYAKPNTNGRVWHYKLYNSSYTKKDFELEVRATVVYADYSSTLNPTQVNIKADVDYNKVDECNYIHDKAHAERYFKALEVESKNKQKEYTFKSTSDFALGSLCAISDVTSTTALVVMEKTHKINDENVYEYKAVEVLDMSGITFDTDYEPAILDLPAEDDTLDISFSRTVIPCDSDNTAKDDSHIYIKIVPHSAFAQPVLKIGGVEVELERGTETEDDEELLKAWYYYEYDVSEYTDQQTVLVFLNGTFSANQTITRILDATGSVSVVQYNYGTETEPNTIGWTTNTLLPRTTGEYIWQRFGTYTPPATEPSTWVVSRLSGKTENQNFSLSVLPSNIIRNLRLNSSQVITLVADVVGYSDPKINYMFNNSFLADIYAVTQDEEAEEDKKYYTFSQTTDTEVNPTKTYFILAEQQYVEQVNLESFETGVTYYEKTETTFETGVYEQVYFAHETSVNVTIPYVNSLNSPVQIALYNGTEQFDQTRISVIDETGEPVFLDVLISDPETSEQGLFIDGDYYVTREGELRRYNNGSWGHLDIENATGLQANNALKALKNAQIDLSTISDSNTVAWFTNLIAENVFAEKVSGNSAFFKNITIENASFINGDLNLVQIKTQAGSSGDTTGITLPSPSKWNIDEIFNDSRLTENSVLTASGSYGSASISKVLKLNNINLNYRPTTSEDFETYVASGTVSYTILNEGSANNGDTITIEPPSIELTRSTYRYSGVTVYRINADQTRTSLGSFPQVQISGFDDPAPVYTINTTTPKGTRYEFEFTNTKGSTADWEGIITITHPAQTFQQAGFNNVGLWVNTGSWNNLGINQLYNSSVGLSFTVNGTTYSKADRYTLANNFATYNFGSLLLNRAYAVVGTGFSYKGAVKTPTFFKRTSSTSAKLLLSTGEVIDFVSGQYVYAQGKIQIAPTITGLVVQDIFPELDNTYNLGRPDRQIKDLYAKFLHPTMEGTSTNKSGSAVVIATYNSGSNWYRIWSDGWIEQGGVEGAGINGPQLFNLATPFTNANYTILKTSHWLFGGTPNSDFFNIFNKTTSTFTTSNSSITEGGVGFSWYACGY